MAQNEGGFEGFPAGEMRFTAVPDLFFTELLPRIDDLAELKVTLHLLWLRQRGRQVIVSKAQLQSDETLMRGLANLAADPEVALEEGLARAVARGSVLHAVVSGDAGVYDVYMLNSEGGRRALQRVQAGEIGVVGLQQVEAPEWRPRPNIFELYEANVGLLSPILADELKDAEAAYSWEWVEEAFKLAVENNVRKWSYIRAILERWAGKGRTMEPLRDILKRAEAGTQKKSTIASSSVKEAEPVCPDCKGMGFVRLEVEVGQPDFGKVVPCHCRETALNARRLAQLRGLSNLAALSHLTFDSFRPEGLGLDELRRKNLREAYSAALHYAQEPDGWLVLLGGYGCGKTHLAVAIAQHCLERGAPALFVIVPDLLDHLRGAYGPHAGLDYEQTFERIRSVHLLVLDDLGAHSPTPWAQEKLFQLFNYRYNLRLPTVVTSNHRLEEIDIRIRSRLIDPELSRLVTILAPDYRHSGVDHHHSELSSLALYANQTFETFDLRQRELEGEARENLKRAFGLARAYAQHPEDWLLFTGGFGCGKTHLAAAIANEQSRQGKPALFVVVPDLLDHLRATFNPNSLIPLDKRFEEVKEAPLLVLDDLGTESATPWAREKLYQLINYRYVARLPTVFTAATEADVDARLKSRLLDIGRCHPFEIIAPSYRGASSRSSGRKLATGRRRR